MYDLPLIRVRGDARALGRGQGEAMAALIRRFVPMRLAAATTYINEVGGATVDDLLAAGRRCFEVFEAWDGAGYAEHCALASAAGVDAVTLFTATNMTDIRDVVLLGEPGPTPPADAEGCSAVLLPGGWTAPDRVLVGQTWDLNPEDLDYVVAVHRQPDDGPATWSVTVAGAPSLVGMNELGLCVGTTNIKTWGSRIGVGYMNVLHRALNQSDFAAAAAIIEEAPRAGAHVYWLADETRFVEWETTPASFVWRGDGDGPIARTNHCLADSHRPLQGEPDSPSSLARLARMEAWLQEQGRTLDDLRALFCSREDGVDSINRRPEDEQGTATNSVVLFDPASRRLQACRGPADRGLWRDLHFEGEPATTPAESSM